MLYYYYYYYITSRMCCHCTVLIKFPVRSVKPRNSVSDWQSMIPSHAAITQLSFGVSSSMLPPSSALKPPHRSIVRFFAIFQKSLKGNSRQSGHGLTTFSAANKMAIITLTSWLLQTTQQPNFALYKDCYWIPTCLYCVSRTILCSTAVCQFY